MSSLSKVIVTRLKDLQPHPNADLLLVGEFDGMPFIVNKNDSKEGDLICIVPFDIICPQADWVGEFVRGKRVRPMKLRGVFSMAVCLPLPDRYEVYEGEDVTERFGFTKWEPPEFRDDEIITDSRNGFSDKSPNGLFLPKYDLESLRKFHNKFIIGENVYITAKLHGENFTVVYWDGRFHIKSRNRWIADGNNKWWNTFRQYDFSFLKKQPGLCLIGEKYGNVPKFRYDCVDGEQRIRIFDVYDAIDGKFYPIEEFLRYVFAYNVERVPELYYGPWKGIEYHKDLTEGKACLGGDIEEGYVCESVNRRFVCGRGLERLKVKWHSEKFLLYQGKIK